MKKTLVKTALVMALGCAGLLAGGSGGDGTLGGGQGGGVNPRMVVILTVLGH